MMPPSPSAPALHDFLQRFPQQEGITFISPPRPFQHDETAYDAQYGIDKLPVTEVERQAASLRSFLASYSLPEGSCALEIGCGTGLASAPLIRCPGFSHVLLTDPSPAFARLTRAKLNQITPLCGHVSFGVLLAEDLGRLPPSSFSFILLRSVLHHILDVNAFLGLAARALAPGGLLVCEEPYMEGYMIMGFLSRLLPGALTAAGLPCSPDDRRLIDHFTSTMQYYCRRDVDKSAAEDKHLFRPDELMATGRDIGLRMTHRPAWSPFSGDAQIAPGSGYFRDFFLDYLLYCMSWPQDLVTRSGQALGEYFDYFDVIQSGSTPLPHCFGTFIFQRQP